MTLLRSKTSTPLILDLSIVLNRLPYTPQVVGLGPDLGGVGTIKGHVAGGNRVGRGVYFETTDG